MKWLRENSLELESFAKRLKDVTARHKNSFIEAIHGLLAPISLETSHESSFLAAET